MNQEERIRWVRVRVGVFVVAAVLAFIGVIYVLGARARLFESRYTIHADFSEVGGLREGATVRASTDRATQRHQDPHAARSDHEGELPLEGR